jgi:p-aminobenzoyl-glutamate transporter AbgT
MSEKPITPKPIDDSDKRLSALFDDLEAGQLDFLDGAAKRLIELTTGLLGVLFTITAFGDKFPPPYLKHNDVANGMAVVTLVFYIVAMLLGMLVIQPRKYPRYPHNLGKMREVFETIRNDKVRWLRWGGIAFWLGSLMLAALAIWVICKA